MKPTAVLAAVLPLLLLVPGLGWGADDPLKVLGSDVRVEARSDGFHLLVRALPGRASIMLTETYELPDHKVATYTWRAPAPNEVNGAEKRLLNGKPLPGPNRFLISSTPVADPVFGPSFEILIPPTLDFGYSQYPGARSGALDVSAALAQPGGKVWFSIRAFAKPYGDYTGAYKDNAFELSTIAVVQELPPDHGKYVKGAEDLFKRLAPTVKAVDPADGARLLAETLADGQDLVWAIDTTKSMKQDLEALRNDLVPRLADLTAGFTNFRLGFVFYRDYQELYVTRTVPLTADFEVWKKELLAAVAENGGDVPEAPVEAIVAGVDLFRTSKADRKNLVVFADAAQHDTPRGPVTEGQALTKVRDAGVSLSVILLPLTTF